MSRAKRISQALVEKEMDAARKMVANIEKKRGEKFDDDEREKLVAKFANNMSKMKSKSAREAYEQQFIKETDKDDDDDDDDKDDDDDDDDDESPKANSKKDQFKKTEVDDDDKDDDDDDDDGKKKK